MSSIVYKTKTVAQLTNDKAELLIGRRPFAECVDECGLPIGGWSLPNIQCFYNGTTVSAHIGTYHYVEGSRITCRSHHMDFEYADWRDNEERCKTELFEALLIGIKNG